MTKKNPLSDKRVKTTRISQIKGVRGNPREFPSGATKNPSAVGSPSTDSLVVAAVLSHLGYFCSPLTGLAASFLLCLQSVFRIAGVCLPLPKTFAFQGSQKKNQRP